GCRAGARAADDAGAPAGCAGRRADRRVERPQPAARVRRRGAHRRPARSGPAAHRRSDAHRGDHQRRDRRAQAAARRRRGGDHQVDRGDDRARGAGHGRTGAGEAAAAVTAAKAFSRAAGAVALHRIGKAFRRGAVRGTGLDTVGELSIFAGVKADRQVKALPKPASPPWDKGIQPISRDSYYSAIACGKQGGANPTCVFWDTGLCKNDDFTLTMYTPYKQVAYEVWQAVKNKQEAPTPSYADAQRTRITVGVTAAPAAKNPIAGVTIKRGGAAIKPVTQSLETGGGGKFIFDFPAFAPGAEIAIELAGRARTVTCAVDKSVLATFR